MNLTKKRQLLIEILIVLLLTNYMFVTVVLKDNIIFKYLRDIVLITLVVTLFYNNNLKTKYNKITIAFMVFLVCSVTGIIQSDSLKIVILVLRRYLLPIMVLFLISRFNFQGKEAGLFKFIFLLVIILSIFGVFQAQILGDNFLRKLGYPVEYSYAYGRDMLYNSFYFGGLGIQRVVATLSSSNICGVAFGTSLLYFLICNRYVTGIKYKKICYIILLLGYLLTFSRSNFVAFFVVGIGLVWKYIPYKKYIILGGVLAGIAVIAIGIIQGTDGIVYKLILWVQATLNMTESSAAGRSGIWKTAFAQVRKSPLGIGFGHVGAVGTNNDLVFSAENSYLTLALDTGWLGAMSYILALLLMAYKLKKKARFYGNNGDNKGKRLCLGGYAVIMYLMVVMFFSNHIQDMEIMALAYVYVGIGLAYIRYNGANRMINNG